MARCRMAGWVGAGLLAAALTAAAQERESAPVGDESRESPEAQAEEMRGDLKLFVVVTDDNIARLEVGDLYRNEDTTYKIAAIKRKSAKGGEFTAQRVTGQSNPQRRWTRISGVGPVNISTRTTMLDLYRQGGPFLHPIALLFVAVVVLSVNGCLVYRRKVQCPPEFVSAAEAALLKGDLRQFEDASRKASGLMAFICRQMTRNFDVFTMEDIRNQVKAATVTQVGRLRVPVRALNLIAVAAPLLGLLGTIIGMVIVFEGVAGTSGAAKASILAAGIRVKLFSTASALIVAIPALFLYFGFNQKLSAIVRECDEIHERFLALLARIKRGDGAAPQAGVARNASAQM